MKRPDPPLATNGGPPGPKPTVLAAIPSLPKVELHCHLDGVLDPVMLRDIRREDPSYPVNPEELERAYPVTGFDAFWRWWDLIRPLQGQLDRSRPVLTRYLARLQAEHVVYSELMIASGQLPRDLGEARERLAALRALAEGYESDRFQVEFLLAIGRNRTPADFAALGDRALALHRAGLIVGVALAGPEPGYPVQPVGRTFDRFQGAGLGIEIHAGEWCGPESVWDALIYGHPSRIGHGVSAFRDARLVETIRERGIHLEMCPTSNLATGAVTGLAAHPIGQALELGLSVSLSTDDPGIFGASMNGEHELLARGLGFGEREFRRIYENALAARFAPDLRVPAPARPR